MKIWKYILSAAALLAFGACNHDADEMVIPTRNLEIASQSAVVINDVTAAEEFTLTWTAAKFGVQTEVEYTVSAAVNGGEAVALTTTSKLYYSTTNGELLEALGINVGNTYSVSFAVKATAVVTGETAEDVLTISITLDKVAYLYMLGGYQGWSETNHASRLLQGADGIFRGFVNILAEGDAANAIKICTQYGWGGTNYGMKDGAISADGDAGNIELTVGLHYLEFNVEQLKLVDVPLTKVALIGEAVGSWDKDCAELRYDAVTNTWVGMAQVTSTKEYKVRFNEMWDVVDAEGNKYNISLGTANGDLQYGGTNLVAANDGIVSFTLNLFDYPYSIVEGGAVAENEEVLYIASSYDNWNYGVAPKMQAGYTDGVFNGQFTGMLNMPAAGEYMFARLQSELGTRYGGSADALVEYVGGQDATGIAVDAGLNYVYADFNAKKAIVVKIESLGLVGGFNNWDAGNPTEFVYDAASNSYKAEVEFATDCEVKFVMNKCWNTKVGEVELQMSLGGSAKELVINGGNLFMKSGKHTFEVDFNKTVTTMAIDGVVADFSPNPETLSLTGAFGHYNWNIGDPTPALPQVGDKYIGFVDMYKPADSTAENAMFKVTYPSYSAWMGGALQEGTTYVYDLAEANGDTVIPFGLYYWEISLTDAAAKVGVATATPMTAVSLIGQIEGKSWDYDVALVSDGAGHYTADVQIDQEFKVRFNNGWDYDLGLAADATVAVGTPISLAPKGGNLAIPEAGVYTVTLNLADMPNTITLVKK